MRWKDLENDVVFELAWPALGEINALKYNDEQSEHTTRIHELQAKK